MKGQPYETVWCDDHSVNLKSSKHTVPVTRHFNTCFMIQKLLTVAFLPHIDFLGRPKCCKSDTTYTSYIPGIHFCGCI